MGVNAPDFRKILAAEYKRAPGIAYPWSAWLFSQDSISSEESENGLAVLFGPAMRSGPAELQRAR